MKQQYITVQMNSTSGPWIVEKYIPGLFGTAASVANWSGPYATKREAQKRAKERNAKA